MADRRSFLRAIRELTGDRIQRYVTIDAVAEHLGIEPDEAERMARQLDDAGLVRVGGGHSVTIALRSFWHRAHLREKLPSPVACLPRRKPTKREFSSSDA